MLMYVLRWINVGCVLGKVVWLKRLDVDGLERRKKLGNLGFGLGID